MKEKGLLRERSYSAAVPYIMEDIDEETRIKRARVPVAFRVEFNSSEEMDEQVSMYLTESGRKRLWQKRMRPILLRNIRRLWRKSRRLTRC